MSNVPTAKNTEGGVFGPKKMTGNTEGFSAIIQISHLTPYIAGAVIACVIIILIIVGIEIWKIKTGGNEDG